MRTIHVIYPPDLGTSKHHAAFEEVRYLNGLCNAAEAHQISVLRYGSITGPEYIELIDQAEQIRLSKSATVWPIVSQTEELKEVFIKRGARAICAKLADDNYIISCDQDILVGLKRHIKNANFILVNQGRPVDESPTTIYPAYSSIITSENRNDYRFFDSVINYHSDAVELTNTDVVVLITDGGAPFHIRLAEEIMVKTGYGVRIFDLRDINDCLNYEHAISTAKCLLYVEQPKKWGVHIIDALSVGTPVIAADGPLSAELISHAVDGFRCRTFREFCDAVTNTQQLSRPSIMLRARQRFNITKSGAQLCGFLDQVSDSWTNGFYTDRVCSHKRYN